MVSKTNKKILYHIPIWKACHHVPSALAGNQQSLPSWVSPGETLHGFGYVLNHQVPWIITIRSLFNMEDNKLLYFKTKGTGPELPFQSQNLV